MQSHRVLLPPGITQPFEVWVNAVRKTEGTDYEVRNRALVFSEPLVQEGGPSKTGWFLGFWGVGTYPRNDEVDLRYEQDGRPRVAHALPLAPD